jgi:hypothetical protein
VLNILWLMLYVLSTVKTGKYREGDENRAEHPPTHVYNSIGALVGALLDQR